MMVEFTAGVGKIFPNSKKLLLKVENPLKIKKTTGQYKFFIWKT